VAASSSHHLFSVNFFVGFFFVAKFLFQFETDVTKQPTNQATICHFLLTCFYFKVPINHHQ